tara:strand:+ start:3319 stop:3624 length:306 start_codon:yes stop_codon:yes gene_type:complete
VKKNTNVNFKKGWFLSHAVHTALPPIFISKFAEKNVIARLAPQSHCSKANETASYHEGEKSILGSLWTDLNQRKAQGTVAEEPVAAHAVTQKKNHENVGAT